MSKLLYLLVFLLISPLLLGFSLFIYASNSTQPTYPPVTPPAQVLGLSTDVFTKSILYSPSYTASFGLADARALIIKKYLNRYNSPLEEYSHQIVNISDSYELDYRLLVAIAQQESNLCKRIPENSFNCWGFGIYGDKVTRFENYPQALEIVAKTLRSEYLDKGLRSPEQIMAKYTPPSLEIGGPWAKGVNQFLSELE